MCLPTTYGEGVPRVLIEAAACGRAIIATDVPGCREIVLDRQNGILIHFGSPKVLADAIRTFRELSLAVLSDELFQFSDLGSINEITGADDLGNTLFYFRKDFWRVSGIFNNGTLSTVASSDWVNCARASGLRVLMSAFPKSSGDVVTTPAN